MDEKRISLIEDKIKGRQTMNNRKRVTLTFEIDDHDGFNDEPFMRDDFLQELSCCVNDPYPDTFVMKIENAATPREHTEEANDEQSVL